MNSPQQPGLFESAKALASSAVEGVKSVLPPSLKPMGNDATVAKALGAPPDPKNTTMTGGRRYRKKKGKKARKTKRRSRR